MDPVPDPPLRIEMVSSEPQSLADATKGLSAFLNQYEARQMQSGSFGSGSGGETTVRAQLQKLLSVLETEGTSRSGTGDKPKDK
jgi:hypothetical protein